MSVLPEIRGITKDDKAQPVKKLIPMRAIENLGTPYHMLTASPYIPSEVKCTSCEERSPDCNQLRT